MAAENIASVMVSWSVTMLMQLLGHNADLYLLVPFLQLIDDKKILNEKCEVVVAELKQVDQKYAKKFAQMQEQHELVRKGQYHGVGGREEVSSMFTLPPPMASWRSTVKQEE